MKKNIFLNSQLFLTALVLAISTSAFSQKTTIWKGGAPGHENDWNYAKNWSTYTVPDGFSDVFILNVSTTSQALPILADATTEVNSLFMEPSASLTIGKGAKLVVLDRTVGVSKNNVHIHGSLFLPKDAATASAVFAKAGPNKF